MPNRLRRSSPHQPNILPFNPTFCPSTAKFSERRALTTELGPILHAARLSRRTEEQLHEAKGGMCAGPREEGD